MIMISTLAKLAEEQTSDCPMKGSLARTGTGNLIVSRVDPRAPVQQVIDSQIGKLYSIRN